MLNRFPVRHAHGHPARSRASAVVVLMLLVACVGAQAQSTARTAGVDTPRVDPLDAKANVPAVRYASSLTAPKPSAEDPPSWRQANDTVTRMGGWRAYAREAQQTAPPPPTAPETAKPMHHGHRGHHTP